MTIQIKEAQNKNEHNAETTARQVKQSTETIKSSRSYSTSSTSILIYVTDRENSIEVNKNLLKPILTEDFSDENCDELKTSFPLFFQNIDTVLIPKKAKRYLEKKVPKKYLRAIDNNRDTAIEKCLLIAFECIEMFHLLNLYLTYLSRVQNQARLNLQLSQIHLQ